MIEILYLAWNRLEFTTRTWEYLLAHTDWGLASGIVAYDDGSEDGTQEYLREAVERAPVPAELRIGDFRSPPAIMNHYLATTQADWFAKIDNDIAVPPAWLNALTSLTEEGTPELIGMEAGMVACPGRPGVAPNGGPYTFERSSHIGGVGLMKVEAFHSRPPIPSRGRYGFTEWQNRYKPRRGWINPDLFVPSLDRIPAEPFATWAEEYVESGWSRPWPKYDPQWMAEYYAWVMEWEAGLAA